MTHLVGPFAAWLLLVTAFTAASACAADVSEASDATNLRIQSLALGGGTIDVVTTQFGHSKLLLCNVHDNEDTSVRAACRVLPEYSGRLVELKHTGQRNLEFAVGDCIYRCDPNRIFTAAGIQRTLADLGKCDEASQAAVSEFAAELLRLYGLDDAAFVISLHNNTDQRYATTSYLPGQQLAQEAAEVSLAADTDPDDFFFVTDIGLFKSLSQLGFNVVLQDNRAVTDDGSLSVYCGRRGLPYVNCEAQHGHEEIQVQMLTALLEVLSNEPIGAVD